MIFSFILFKWLTFMMVHLIKSINLFFNSNQSISENNDTCFSFLNIIESIVMDSFLFFFPTDDHEQYVMSYHEQYVMSDF